MRKILEIYTKRGYFYERKNIAQNAAHLIATCYLLEGVVHGDLKWSNILLQINDTEHKMFFVDLD